MVLDPHIQIQIRANTQQAIDSFNRIRGRLGLLDDRVRNLDLNFRRLDRIWALLAAGSGLALVRTFAKMAGEMQKVQLQIGVFERSTDAVGPAMERILTLADRVPFTLNTMTSSFVRLKASGLDPIVDDQGNGPLKALSDAVAAFGGGDEIFKRATIAIQQMAGKGVISMEELRQQLGEAVPTAMRIMARELDISVSELIRTVSRGELEFNTGIEALFRGFEKAFGGAGDLLVDTIEGQMLAFQKEFQRLSQGFVQAGGADVITAAFKVLNSRIRELGQSILDNLTPENIDKFIDSMERLALKVDAALEPARNLFAIIGEFITAAANIAGTLPEEIVGGGILGFVLFGRKGVIAGALFGLVSDELLSIAEGISTFIQGMFSALQSLGITDIAVGGLLGFLIFGKTGALIGLAVGIISELIDAWQYMTGQLERLVISLLGGLREAFVNLFSPQSFKEAFARGFTEAANEFEKNYIAEHGLDQFNEVFGDSSILKKTGEAATEASAKVNGLTQAFADLRQNMKDIAAQREAITSNFASIDDIPGLNPTDITRMQQLAKGLVALETRALGAGNAMDTLKSKTAVTVAELQGIKARFAESVQGPLTDAQQAGFDRTMQFLDDLIASYNEFTDVIVKNSDVEIFSDIESQIARFKEQIDVFGVGAQDGFDLVSQAVQKVEARFAGLQKQLDNILDKGDKLSSGSEEEARLLEIVAELQEMLNTARAKAIDLITQQTEAKQKKIRLDIEEALANEQLAVTLAALELSYDKASIAALQAEQQILDTIRGIDEQILDIQQKLLDDPSMAEFANATIAQLEAIKQQWIEMSDEIIERARFNASDFGQLMNRVAASLQDSMADAFESLINGTKSAKEILLDFYASITRAAAEYLAKQALIGIFGGSSGDGLGSILASAFGGAATGAQFTVGGAGATDSQLVAFRATPGEVVSVDTPGRSVNRDRNGWGGDHFEINIKALDAQSVRDLFRREGGALVEALRGRRAINRGLV